MRRVSAAVLALSVFEKCNGNHRLGWEQRIGRERRESTAIIPAPCISCAVSCQHPAPCKLTEDTAGSWPNCTQKGVARTCCKQQSTNVQSASALHAFLPPDNPFLQGLFIERALTTACFCLYFCCFTHPGAEKISTVQEAADLIAAQIASK